MRLAAHASALALLLVAATACGRDAPPTAPILARSAGTARGTTGAPAEVTRALLERAADGLLYTSESDYTFTYLRLPGPVPTPLTVEDFRRTAGVPADAPIEVVSLDDFFARHIERVDPADPVAAALVPRYRRLRETVRHAVREPRVFRVGRIAIDCYLVGTGGDDEVVGLRTVSIET